MKKISDEEIYKLREQGKTYQEIVDYYMDKGIKITVEPIRKRCKRIYEEKGEKEPKAKAKTKRRNDIKDEEIYKLREQGMSYQEIADYFNEKGIKISKQSIYNRCKRIYSEKDEKEPIEKCRKKIIVKISDEEIYELREQGKSYQKIADYYIEKGIKITVGQINGICKRIYEEKGEEEPEITRRRNDISDEKIYELREQGKTYQEIVKYYNEKGIKILYSTIRNRCKKIYEKKGIKEPIIKRKQRQNNESLEELNQKLNKRIEEKLGTEKEIKDLKGSLERKIGGHEK